MARILLHTLLFPPDANSNAYVLADLARELRKKGHEIIVLTTTPHYNVTEVALAEQPMTPVLGRWLLRSNFEGIPCYHVQVPAVKGGIRTRIKTALQFHALGWHAIKKLGLQFDIILSQSPPLSIGLLSARIARRRKAKSIFVVQDIQPDSLINQGRIKNPLFICLLRKLEHQVYRQSDAICSISEGLVERLRARVPKKTVLREIPNFVNTDLYRPLPRENDFSKAHGLNSHFVVSYVGNIGNAQDFTPLTAAARQCADLQIRFLLVGGGIKYSALQEEVTQGHLTNVTLCGYQPRVTTPLINASSDLCLVLLSAHVHNFSFPSKIYTLMACGKPILLYGHPEADVARFVQKTGVGWVVPNGDIHGFVATVRRLYHKPREIEECGNRAVAVVKDRFTAQAVAQQYHNLMEELMMGGRPSNAA